MHRHAIIASAAAFALLGPTLAATPAAATPLVGRLAATSPSRVTGCGVERWSVKTGTDPDARLVDQARVTPTNLGTLRALPAPVQPPLSSRVKPVETTVWSLDAILLRYKQETDSDYHLVLADTGGRTLIAEIPAPECVGPSSPFLPAMRTVRTAFTARFHPTPSFQRVSVTVHVSGVGFFDPTPSFQRVSVTVHVSGVGFFDVDHGQSGVAPNAIELHPVLSIRWGNGATIPPAGAGAGAGTPAPTIGTPVPTIETRTSGALTVRVGVSPNPTSYGIATTVQAMTVPGAPCRVRVVYASGTTSTSRALQTMQTADGHGAVAWTWRFGSHTMGQGRATVTCVLGNRQGTGSAPVTVG